MKSIIEKIGYIDQKQFNLDNVVNSMVEFMTSPDIHWDTNYEVKGKPNVKDLEGFLYHTFTFDLDNPKLGFIKVILVNIDTDKVNTSYKFQGFIDDDEAAFYSPVDSTVDKKKRDNRIMYKLLSLLYRIITSIILNALHNFEESYNMQLLLFDYLNQVL